MAVPHDAVDGMRATIAAIRHLGVNRRLITTGGVELVRFPGGAILMAGTDDALPRLRGLFARQIRREPLAAVRVAGRLQDHLLVHLFQIVAAHAEIHIHAPYRMDPIRLFTTLPRFTRGRTP